MTLSPNADALHLTPVTQTYQLRPTLTYLDAIVATDRRAKRESKKNLDEDSDENAEVSDTELKKEAAKAVQVSVKQSLDSTNGPGGGGFGKGPLGGGNGRAGAGLFEPLRAMEGEAWIDLKHYHADVSFNTPIFSWCLYFLLTMLEVAIDTTSFNRFRWNVCFRK